MEKGVSRPLPSGRGGREGTPPVRSRRSGGNPPRPVAAVGREPPATRRGKLGTSSAARDTRARAAHASAGSGPGLLRTSSNFPGPQPPRGTAVPRDSSLASRGGHLYWHWAFESPQSVKGVVRKELGEENTPQARGGGVPGTSLRCVAYEDWGGEGWEEKGGRTVGRSHGWEGGPQASHRRAEAWPRPGALPHSPVGRGALCRTPTNVPPPARRATCAWCCCPSCTTR